MSRRNVQLIAGRDRHGPSGHRVLDLVVNVAAQGVIHVGVAECSPVVVPRDDVISVEVKP